MHRSNHHHGQHITESVPQRVNEHSRKDTVRLVAQPAIQPSQQHRKHEQWPEGGGDKQDSQMGKKKDQRLQCVAYEESEASHEPSSQQPPEKRLFSERGEEGFVQESAQD